MGSMLVRLPLAFVAGLTIYMVAMVMTVYDGLLSMVFQPIVGTMFTAVALGVLTALGTPLLLQPVWQRWRRVWWISIVLLALGLASLVVSWHPSLRVEMSDPEIGGMRESFQPTLAVGGWLAVMFSLAFCPKIGLHGDRRWL